MKMARASENSLENGLESRVLFGWLYLNLFVHTFQNFVHTLQKGI